jgi:excinuclease UvrABC nuclease subunit
MKAILDLPCNAYCGCYLLFNDNVLVYVGVSYDILFRMNAHRKNKIFNSIKYIDENDYLNAIQIENYYINEFKPKYNLSPAKLEYKRAVYGENFNIKKIPYPTGWNKKETI